jgi:hypothetical protein
MVRKPTRHELRRKVSWPGATPILASRFSAKIPSGFVGRSRPQVFASRANFQDIPRPHSCRLLTEQTDAARMRNPGPTKENTMPLVKPPEPVISQRRYYLRIEESLAQTMERCAEFLGTASIDHLVAQALQFIFKRDTQFKSWLEQNPEPTPKPVRSKASSKSTNSNGGRQ